MPDYEINVTTTGDASSQQSSSLLSHEDLHRFVDWANHNVIEKALLSADAKQNLEQFLTQTSYTTFSSTYHDQISPFQQAIINLDCRTLELVLESLSGIDDKTHQIALKEKMIAQYDQSFNSRYNPKALIASNEKLHNHKIDTSLGARDSLKKITNGFGLEQARGLNQFNHQQHLLDIPSAILKMFIGPYELTGPKRDFGGIDFYYAISKNVAQITHPLYYDRGDETELKTLRCEMKSALQTDSRMLSYDFYFHDRTTHHKYPLPKQKEYDPLRMTDGDCAVIIGIWYVAKSAEERVVRLSAFKEDLVLSLQMPKGQLTEQRMLRESEQKTQQDAYINSRRPSAEQPVACAGLDNDTGAISGNNSHKFFDSYNAGKTAVDPDDDKASRKITDKSCSVM